MNLYRALNWIIWFLFVSLSVFFLSCKETGISIVLFVISFSFFYPFTSLVNDFIFFKVKRSCKWIFIVVFLFVYLLITTSPGCTSINKFYGYERINTIYERDGDRLVVTAIYEKESDIIDSVIVELPETTPTEKTSVDWDAIREDSFDMSEKDHE